MKAHGAATAHGCPKGSLHIINTKRPQKLLTVPKVSADAQQAEQNGFYVLVFALHGSQGASEMIHAQRKDSTNIPDHGRVVEPCSRSTFSEHGRFVDNRISVNIGRNF